MSGSCLCLLVLKAESSILQRLDSSIPGSSVIHTCCVPGGPSFAFWQWWVACGEAGPFLWFFTTWTRKIPPEEDGPNMAVNLSFQEWSTRKQHGQLASAARDRPSALRPPGLNPN